MDKNKVDKRGQAMIWVIVALALSAIIILFFVLREKVKLEIPEKIEEDPKGFIDECTRRNVNEAVDLILPQGGFVRPEHAKTYNGINVSYLCYNKGNYLPCVNEHPLFLSEMKDEIKNYIRPKIDKCFYDYKAEMEKRQNEVSLREMKLDVELGPERIYVDIDRKISINKEDGSLSVNIFDAEIISPVYDLGRVAMEIASQEAEYCYFEYNGYMILYPKYKIKLTQMSDSTRIYSITDKKSGKEINIAVRGCAIPPGL